MLRAVQENDWRYVGISVLFIYCGNINLIFLISRAQIFVTQNIRSTVIKFLDFVHSLSAVHYSAMVEKWDDATSVHISFEQEVVACVQSKHNYGLCFEEQLLASGKTRRPEHNFLSILDLTQHLGERGSTPIRGTVLEAKNTLL